MAVAPAMMMAIQIGMAVAGAMVQRSQQRKAASAQLAMRTAEANAAMDAARRTRESAMEVLRDQREQTADVTEQRKSDRARAADREAAELVAFAAERGATDTNSFLAEMGQLQFFSATDLSRLERDERLRLEEITQQEKQVVEDQRRVFNQSSLSLYAANIDNKLTKAFANQNAFLQIAGATTKAVTSHYANKATLSNAQNISSTPTPSVYSTAPIAPPTWK